jgi:DNA-binding transcriptional LysR family regulator
MEMHQVRYFLAVARTLNFTRAAEQCNVSQPALTRAIRQLEEELAGKLLRREGKHSHLTDLGVRMVPLMQQCYESATAAKTLASSFRKGATQALSIALSHSIDGRLLAGPIGELQRAIPGLQLRLERGDAGEIAEGLKKGGVDFAVAGPMGLGWDRLDAWPLFEEPFELTVHERHPLAREARIGARRLEGQRLLVSTRCESAEALAAALEAQGIAAGEAHQIAAMGDLLALLEAGLGVAFLPQSAARRASFRRMAVEGFAMSRAVSLYGVSGRQRSPAADAFMRLMRARDWAAEVR